MNSNKLLAAMLGIISSFSIAQNNASLFERIEPIKKNLYKISAEELCNIINVAYEPVPIITANQLKQELQKENNIRVVNVLTEYYHNDCHIKDSINVPLPELVDKADAWDHAQKIIIYCALDACDAGEKGCILLKQMGFTNVYDYRGGIKEWFQLNYPTEGPAISEYLHTKWLPAMQDECKMYPDSIVCSRQTRWIHKYKQQ